MSFPRLAFGLPTREKRYQGLFDTTSPDEIPSFSRFGQEPSEPPAPEPPLSYYDRASRLVGNAPQKKALLELLANAPSREEYKPNWKDRLFAGAVGGLTGYEEGPLRGYTTATGMLDRPYNEASEEYDRKLKRVGAQAQLESADIDQQLNVLDKSETYADRDLDRAERQKQYERAGWHVYTDDTDGMLKATHVDKPGEVRILGRAGQSIAEKEAAEKIKYEREQAGRMEVVGANNEARAALQREKVLATATALRTKAGTYKPGDIENVVNSRLADYVTQRQVDIGKYLTEDDRGQYVVLPNKTIPSGYGIFQTPADTPEDLAIKDELRAMLGAIYKGQAPAVNPVGVTPGDNAPKNPNIISIDEVDPITNKPIAKPTTPPAITPGASGHIPGSGMFGGGITAPAPVDPSRLGVGAAPPTVTEVPPAPSVSPNRLGVPGPNFGQPPINLNAVPPPAPPPPIDPNRLGIPGGQPPISLMTPPTSPGGLVMGASANSGIGGKPFNLMAPPPPPSINASRLGAGVPGGQPPININTTPPPPVRTPTPSPAPSLSLGGAPAPIPTPNGEPLVPPELTGEQGFGPRGAGITMDERSVSRNPLEAIKDKPTYYAKTPYTRVVDNKPAAAPVRTISSFEDLINQEAKKSGVDSLLAHALIKQESKYNPKAKSKAGAVGLMQLMPGTARSLGVKDSTNPEQNVRGGMKLLSDLVKKYKGNIPLALIAYNRGEGNANRWVDKGAKLESLPKETQDYVNLVMRNYNLYKEEAANKEKR